VPVPVVARSKTWVCGRSPAEILGSNATRDMDVCDGCCVLACRGLCDELITRPEESFRLRCVVVCDLENFFSPPNCPDRLWGPPSFLFSSYRCPLSFAVKRPGAWTWPLPSSAEFNDCNSMHFLFLCIHSWYVQGYIYLYSSIAVISSLLVKWEEYCNKLRNKVYAWYDGYGTFVRFLVWLWKM